MRPIRRLHAHRLAVAMAIAALLVAPAAAPSLAAAPSRAAATSRAAAPGSLGASTTATGVQLGTTSPGRRVDVGALPAPRGATHRPAHAPLLPAFGGRSTTSPNLAAKVPTLAPLAPVEAGASAAPAPTRLAFNGLAGADNESLLGVGREPPDPWVAVGPDHVLQAVNSLVRMSRRDGTAIRTVSLPAFFGLPDSADTFDPHVRYDALHGRWLATEAGVNCDQGSASPNPYGFLDLAISVTGDPSGIWEVYSIVFNDAVPDYPGLGTSADKVVVSDNEFDIFELCPGGVSSGYVGARELVVDWNDIIKTPASLSFAASAADPGLFTWRPAAAVPAAPTDTTAWSIVGIDNGGPTLDVGFGSVTGQVTPLPSTIAFGTVKNLTTALGLDTFRQAPPPRQPGSPATIIDATDLRPTDAALHAGQLAFVATTDCTPTGDTAPRACVHVTELAVPASPGGTPTLTQDFLVDQVGTDSFMGGVGFAGNGDLHLTWTASSPASAASAFGAYQRSTDAANTVSAAYSLGSGGTVTYTGTRWGDYVGVATDPSDPTAVWVGAQRTAADGSWTTRVSEVLGAGSTYTAVTPVRLLDTRVGNGLSGFFNANVPRTWQVTGRGGIPADAVAVTGNVTVVGQTAAGYVAVTPVATATPTTSTINVPLGDVRANNVTIPLAGDGSLSAVYRAASGHTNLVFDVTGYFTASDAGATYATVAPARLLDTRVANGLSGPFAAGTPRTWQISGRGGVPAGAVAITGNLTVVGQTKAGFVALTPAPDPAPATSTLNFPLKDVRANGFAVPLSAAGKLSAVYMAAAGGTTDLVLDVTGYFVPDASGARFVPLAPGRRMDTRIDQGLSGALVAGTARTLAIRPYAGVASNAVAVTGNLTVVGQTKAGFVAMTQVTTATPTTSTINFPVGDIRANGVFAPLAAAGTVGLVYRTGTSGTTDLILDVTGYFR